jgi:hypothetical protein
VKTERGSVQISLGKCHYGGFDEAATATAVREDGTGWIAICEEHRDQAEKDGYVPGEQLDNLEPVTGEGADVPEGERENDAGDKIGGVDGDGEETNLDDMMDEQEGQT